MRKLLIVSAIITMFGGFSLALPASVGAVDVINPVCNNPNAEEKPKICNDDATTSSENPLFGPNGILTSAINILSLIAGILAVIVMIIGGTKMIASSGDSNSVASAKRTVLYAVISLVIVAFAQVGVHLLLSKL